MNVTTGAGEGPTMTCIGEGCNTTAGLEDWTTTGVAWGPVMGVATVGVDCTVIVTGWGDGVVTCGCPTCGCPTC